MIQVRPKFFYEVHTQNDHHMFEVPFFFKKNVSKNDTKKNVSKNDTIKMSSASLVSNFIAKFVNDAERHEAANCSIINIFNKLNYTSPVVIPQRPQNLYTVFNDMERIIHGAKICEGNIWEKLLFETIRNSGRYDEVVHGKNILMRKKNSKK